MSQRELFIDKVRNCLISVSIRLAGKTTVKLGILRSKAENVKQKVITLSVKYGKHAVPENVSLKIFFVNVFIYIDMTLYEGLASLDRCVLISIFFNFSGCSSLLYFIFFSF